MIVLLVLHIVMSSSYESILAERSCEFYYYEMNIMK